MSDHQKPLWQAMHDAYWEACDNDFTEQEVRAGWAAELCVLRDVIVPEEPKPQRRDYTGFGSKERWLSAFSAWNARQQVRASLTAEVERAYPGFTKRT